MKLKCVIDSLGSGGAQRQLCNLAVSLKKCGVDVSMLTYHDNKFFLPLIEQAGIRYENIKFKSLITRALELRKILRKGKQDVVLAFLPGPSVYAELASLPSRKWGLVVSERSAVPNKSKIFFPPERIFHLLSDYVVTNSHTNRLIIERSIHQLSDRVVTIYNSVDLVRFHPQKRKCEKSEKIKIAVVASHKWVKNLKGLVRALSIVRHKRPEIKLEVNWYGDIHPDRRPYDEGAEMIRREGLENFLNLYPSTQAIEDVYNTCDAVALLSFYEGLPNVICEAMACGCPILMSNVCDAESLVNEGENGFLFNPHSAIQIADKLISFCDLSDIKRANMGYKSRQMAELMFGPDKITEKYMQTLEAAAQHKIIAPSHWVPDVPRSAYTAIG